VLLVRVWLYSAPGIWVESMTDKTLITTSEMNAVKAWRVEPPTHKMAGLGC